MCASTHVHNWNRGGFSDYKKSRGSRPPFGIPVFIIILQKTKKSNCILVIKVAFRFQIEHFWIQKLRSVYKYSIVNL